MLNRKRGRDSDSEEDDSEQETLRSGFKPMSFTSGGSFNPIGNANAPKMNNKGFSDRKAGNGGVSYGIGEKLMSKMGYVSGKGLGINQSGITEPIKQELRPQGVGLGADPKGKSKPAKPKAKPIRPSKPTKQSKPLSKTVEDLKARNLTIPQSITKILDMTQNGQELKEVRLLHTDVQDLGKDQDYERVRHELKQLEVTLSNISMENDDLETRSSELKYFLASLEGELEESSKKLMLIKSLVHLEELKHVTPEEDYETLGNALVQVRSVLDIDQTYLSDILISVFSAIFDWSLATIRRTSDYILLIKINTLVSLFVMDYYRTFVDSSRQKFDPGYVSLMHLKWLPWIQNVLSLGWTIDNLAFGTEISTAWLKVLPKSLHNSFMGVINIKLKRFIDEWDPRKDKSATKFPGTYMLEWASDNNEISEYIRPKYVTFLRQLDLSKDCERAKESFWVTLFGPTQLEQLLGQNIVPRLIRYLNDKFTINPADQQVDVLKTVLLWIGEYVSGPDMTRIFIKSFFPKWLQVLYEWLTTPGANFEEISEWYITWYDWFPLNIKKEANLQNGFRKGLDLINSALDLENKEELEYPTSPVALPIQSKPDVLQVAKEEPIDLDLSYRDVVEDFCFTNGIIFESTKLAHPQNGHLLFNIGTAKKGASGLKGYFDEDIFWIKSEGQNGNYEPVDDLSRLLSD